MTARGNNLRPHTDPFKRALKRHCTKCQTKGSASGIHQVGSTMQVLSLEAAWHNLKKLTLLLVETKF